MASQRLRRKAKNLYHSVRRWALSQTGTVLKDGTKVPRRYIRQTYKLNRFRVRYALTVEKAMKTTAKIVFGRNYKKLRTGEFIDELMSNLSEGRGAAFTAIQKARNKGITTQEMQGILDKIRKFNDSEYDYAEKTADARHTMGYEIQQRIKIFGHELKEAE
jgi:hypothetical protein